ncbi:MAG: hypothetical protein SOR77_07910 [Peptoniphilus sp.]|uniref:hypothetical protein n=1 Tax=Peptoniphilus sp. TaxID=1971214 RepID=UPI002A74B17A|nr:hypothetical protein [Peptoniphilus sp.]MDY2987542.1 hypothetical protein [Peptoniphilus sp.]
MVFSFLILFSVTIILYVLYNNGIVSLSTKVALLFYEKFSLSNNNHHAKFKFCTGFTRRVLKFEQNRIYDFYLENNLSKGAVCVEILDSEKNVLFTLDSLNPSRSQYMLADTKYFFKVNFKKASGYYKFSWK